MRNVINVALLSTACALAAFVVAPKAGLTAPAALLSGSECRFGGANPETADALAADTPRPRLEPRGTIDLGRVGGRHG